MIVGFEEAVDRLPSWQQPLARATFARMLDDPDFGEMSLARVWYSSRAWPRRQKALFVVFYAASFVFHLFVIRDRARELVIVAGDISTNPEHRCYC